MMNQTANLQRILVLLSPVLVLNSYPFTIESPASSHFKIFRPDSGRILWTDNGRLKTLNLLFHPRVTFDVVEAGRFLPLTVFPLVSLVCTLFCTLQ